MSKKVTVPNGTVADLVTKYRTFAKQTAENIVRLAETLIEARSTLSEIDFDLFCDEVGLDPDGSTFKKLIKIGTEASRFEPFFERVPNNWTTLYKLATLQPDQFLRLTESSLFTPLMTASDVNEIVADRTNGQKTPLSRDVIIDLTGNDLEKKLQLYYEICDLVREYGFHMKVDRGFKKVVRNSRGTSKLPTTTEKVPSGS